MQITKATQIAIAGQDREVLSLSLLQNETRNRTILFKDSNGNAINITGYTFQFRMIERQATSIEDTPDGINIVGLATKAGATPQILDTNVTIVSAANGQVNVFFPSSITANEPADPDSTMPIIYTGFIGITQSGVNPTVTKIPLLLLVSNDGA